MYSRQEASSIRKEFWTTLGQYMSPVPSASGQKVHWVNYKTGVRDFCIRMDASEQKAMIALELNHDDTELQQLYFEMLEQLTTLFDSMVNSPWHWGRLLVNSSGKTVSRIYAELEPVNILRRDDWPAMIAFFKEHLLELDEFWQLVQDRFQYE